MTGDTSFRAMPPVAPEGAPLSGKRDIWYESTDGLKLYAADYGPADAPLTALCMHGLTRNHKDFEPMIARLDILCRYISVDVRGRGLSDRDPNKAYTPDVYARDMITLLDTLGLQKVVLIGTSMGGLMAMLMAAVAKERIQGVVLNDVGPVVNVDGLKRIAGYTSGVRSFPDWQSAAGAIGATQKEVFPEFTADDWMDFARRTCRETESGAVVFDYDPAITEGMNVAAPGWRVQFLAWRLFGKMTKLPLLIIRGENSDILTAKTAGMMRRRGKDARLVAVKDRGHAPTLSEPDAVAAISDFLAKQLAAV